MCLIIGCVRALQAASPEMAEVGRIDLGDWLGGEGIFIPNSGEGSEEDDGFLVSFVSPKDGGSSGKQGGSNSVNLKHNRLCLSGVPKARQEYLSERRFFAGVGASSPARMRLLF